MDEKFEPLKPDEVASLGKDWKNNIEMFYLPETFKSKEVQKNVANYLIGSISKLQEVRTELLNEGLEGEALKFGSNGWQKGKIRCRIILEFCPEEPEEEEEEEEEKETEGSETSEETETNEIEINNFDSLDDLRKELNE